MSVSTLIRRSLPASLLLLAACGGTAPEPVTQAAPPPADPEPTVETETVTDRYTCPGAGRIDIVRDGRYARLTMTDGRVVFIGAIQGSRPPIWSEVGLRFVADGDFIELSQESGRVVPCTLDDEVAAPDAAAG
jgi:hypothetical protein